MQPLFPRRTILSVVSGIVTVGVAGCTTRGSSNEPQYRRIELNSVDSIDDAHEVSIEPSVTESRITPDHPAQIRIEVTNEGPDRHFVENREGILFEPWQQEQSDDPRGLILRVTSITDDSDEPDDGDGRWSVHYPDGGGAVGEGRWTFPGGETITHEYKLLDDAGYEGYYPPGSYRFETEFDIRSVEEYETVAAFTWGFSIVVRESEPE